MSSADPHSVFANTMMMESQSGQAEAVYGFLGRYRLDRMIGHGAMGAVFEAFDTTLDRTLAIKTLYSPVSSQDDAAFNAATVDAAILKEARAAATLNHPQIVTVYDAGRAMSTTLQRELPYVAMELLDGADLRSRLQRGQRYSVREAVSLVGKLALALDHAHKAGILHRDIKPANIFITERSGPKLVDFGLAQLTSRTQRQPLSDAPVQVEAMVAGSPQYMAPEAITGAKAGTTLYNEASDVYSLGVVFYELICGQLPYQADTLEQLQRNILEGKAPAPHELNPSLPKELSALVMKAIDKSASQRFRSAAQMGRELRRWGQGDGAGLDLASTHPTINAAEPASTPASATSDSLPPMSGSTQELAANSSSAQELSKVHKSRKTLAILGISALIVVAAVTGWWNVAHRGGGVQAQAADDSAQKAPASQAAPATLQNSSPASVTLSANTPSSSEAASTAINSTTANSATNTATAVSAASSSVPGSTPVAVSITSAAEQSVVTATQAVTPVAAAGPGRVRLTILPWGEIEVDGKKMGVSPPLMQFNLEPGRHVVTVRNADFSPRSFTINVEAGKTARVTHTFH